MNGFHLKVYNTLTKQKEAFVPLEEGRVKIYVCGVTPYNHPHIGNARPFIVWDVVRRYLEYIGFEVFHVQNFTDIDDKIIKAANSEGVTWEVIADRYIAAYFEAMDALNVRRAHIYPRVSQCIGEIIEMVEILIGKGYAYRVEDDESVYYSVEKFSGYGKLSGRSLDDMQAGARVDVDEKKNHPMDFALWKAAKAGEPSWDSPWGKGRPGWHIECSVMSKKYLGDSFDFHGGGSDLIFPHHENEIAQSEAELGTEPFVRYWLHNGFVTLNEEKMSKSLGNFFLISDILKYFPPETLRFFILSTHYRSPLDFNDERLEEAEKGLERLKTALNNLNYLRGLPQNEADVSEALAFKEALDKAKAEFFEAMNDDFNTSLALGHMFSLAREINTYHQKVIKEERCLDSKIVEEAAKVYLDMAGIIGILEDAPVAAGGGADIGLVGKLMEIIIDIRQEARDKKDWKAADEIRNRLSEAGIALIDSPQGVSWKKQ